MKLYLTIGNAEHYANGNLDFAFRVYHNLDTVKEFGREVIAELDVDIDIDDNKIRDQQLKEIDREEKRIRAEFQHKLDQITDKKNQLLALEVKQ